MQDNQLAERCPVKSYSHLTGWNYNSRNKGNQKSKREFRKFLAGYEQFLPFPEPSNLQNLKLAKRIYDLAMGYNLHKSRTSKKNEVSTRQIARVLKVLSSRALEMDSACITNDHLDYYEEEWL